MIGEVSWHTAPYFQKQVRSGASCMKLTLKLMSTPLENFLLLLWNIPLLFLLMLYVTMVYGPIAALLVEMFPTRIRYTSMSLPYHIGNGWFGGLLPTTAFAMVAATGDIYYGLWYPVIVAAMTFVIGMLFIRETKDVDIYAKD